MVSLSEIKPTCVSLPCNTAVKIGGWKLYEMDCVMRPLRSSLPETDFSQKKKRKDTGILHEANDLTDAPFDF